MASHKYGRFVRTHKEIKFVMCRPLTGDVLNGQKMITHRHINTPQIWFARTLYSGGFYTMLVMENLDEGTIEGHAQARQITPKKEEKREGKGSPQ